MEDENKSIAEQKKDDLYVGVITLIASGMFVLTTVVAVESRNIPVSVVSGLAAGFLLTGAMMRLGRRVRNNYGE